MTMLSESTIELPARAPNLGERQMAMKTIFIEHDRYQDAAQFIQRAHYPVEGGLPDFGRIFTLTGESRAGKSSVAIRYVKQRPPAVGESGMHTPVIYVAVLGEGMKALLTTIADALGLVYSSRIPGPALQLMIMRQLVKQKVEFILLDEVNTIISETNQQTLRHFRTLLRKLVDECHLNIVCSGLEEIHELLAGDSQLTGRGGLPNHIVKPYSWDSEEERRLFRLLCAELHRRLPFDRRTKFGDAWFAERLFLSSGGGIVGRLTDFIYSAGCSALNDDAEGIEIGHLAEAYERIKNPEHNFNPWVHDLSRAPKDSKSLLAGRHPCDLFKKKGK